MKYHDSMWATAHNPANVLIDANVKLFSCFLLQFRGNKLLKRLHIRFSTTAKCIFRCSISTKDKSELSE